jgi:hypothetical protein
MTAVAMKCMIFWERSNCRLLLGDLPWRWRRNLVDVPPKPVNLYIILWRHNPEDRTLKMTSNVTKGNQGRLSLVTNNHNLFCTSGSHFACVHVQGHVFQSTLISQAVRSFMPHSLGYIKTLNAPAEHWCQSVDPAQCKQIENAHENWYWILIRNEKFFSSKC